MESSPIVPSVSLVLYQAVSATGQASAAVLARELNSLEIPATWVISEPQQAKILADKRLVSAMDELALEVTARTPQRLRTDLSNSQAAVQAVSGHEVSTVVGDPQQLRSRAALLADLGIGAVLSNSTTSQIKPPRPLPCGLWQLDSSVSIPRPRRLWSLLAGRRVTAQQLQAAAPQQVVAIDLSSMSGRDLSGCGQLLREIADAVQGQQLRVATIRELGSQLASKNEIKPQRSILRAA